MKYPGFETGMMMSGDAPTPSTHSDHLFDMENQPVPSKMMSDTGIPKSEIITEPFTTAATTTTCKVPNHTLASHDKNSDLEMSKFSTAIPSNERRSIQIEENHVDEISPSASCSTAKAFKSDGTTVSKPDEVIESLNDEVDKPSSIKEPNNQPQDDDSCFINCLFYLDECCTCTIV